MPAKHVAILLTAAFFIFPCATAQVFTLSHQTTTPHLPSPLPSSTPTTTTTSDTTTTTIRSFPDSGAATESSRTFPAGKLTSATVTTVATTINAISNNALNCGNFPPQPKEDDASSPTQLPPGVTRDGEPSWHPLLLVLHVLGIALSLASNGSIVAVIARTSVLHTPSSVSFLALAFSDLLLSLVWHVTELVQLGADFDLLPHVGGAGGGLRSSSPSPPHPFSSSPAGPASPSPLRFATVVEEDTSRALAGDVVDVGDDGWVAFHHHPHHHHGATTTTGAFGDGQTSVLAESGLLPVLVKSYEACQLVGFLWQSLLATSTLYQAVIACDRYLFIVHPLRYETFITQGRVLVVLVVVSLLAMVLPATVMISGGAYTYMQPAGTCVSHIMWYTLFIALVFLPSFTVTLASNAGIWSLCVRQLNTPGRARLVREVRQHTHAYNLDEQNGRVAVRRDVADEFRCCIPVLRRFSNGSQRSLGDGTSCLQHLVQNSSLMFVEGFFAAVSHAETDDEGAAGVEGGEGGAGGGGGGGGGWGEAEARDGEGREHDPPKTVRNLFQDIPTISLPTPPTPASKPARLQASPSCSPSVHLRLPDKKTCHLGVVRPTYALFRTHSDPEASKRNGLAEYISTCAAVPGSSSPIVLTTAAASSKAAAARHNRRTQFRRTTSFHLTPCPAQKLGHGPPGHRDVQEEAGGYPQPGGAEVQSVSLEALELSVLRFNSAPKSQNHHLSASNPSSPSLISIRSSPFAPPRFFRSVSSASFSPYISTTQQPPPSPADHQRNHHAGDGKAGGAATASASTSSQQAKAGGLEAAEGGSGMRCSGEPPRGIVNPVVGWVLAPSVASCDSPRDRRVGPTVPSFSSASTTTTPTPTSPTTITAFVSTTTAVAPAPFPSAPPPSPRGAPRSPPPPPPAVLQTFRTSSGRGLGNIWQEDEEDVLLSGGSCSGQAEGTEGGGVRETAEVTEEGGEGGKATERRERQGEGDREAEIPPEAGGLSPGSGWKPQLPPGRNHAGRPRLPRERGKQLRISIHAEEEEEGEDEGGTGPRGGTGSGGEEGGDSRKRPQERGRSDVMAEVKVPLRRWAKAALLVALPVICIVLTAVPLVAVQTWWVIVGAPSDPLTGGSWVCHVIYVIVPSLNSILISLTNRHVRQGLVSGLCRRHYQN